MRKFGRTLQKLTVVRAVGAEVHFRSHDVHVDDWSRRYEELGLKLSDMGEVFSRFGKYMVQESIPATFAAKGRPKRWAILSPKYSMMRYGKTGVVASLVLSGKMRGAFKQEPHPRSMRIVNRAKYWTYHQFGTEEMPQRIIIQMLEEDEARFLKTVHEYLAEGLPGGAPG